MLARIETLEELGRRTADTLETLAHEGMTQVDGRNALAGLEAQVARLAEGEGPRTARLDRLAAGVEALMWRLDEQTGVAAPPEPWEEGGSDRRMPGPPAVGPEDRAAGAAPARPDLKAMRAALASFSAASAFAPSEATRAASAQPAANAPPGQGGPGTGGDTGPVAPEGADAEGTVREA